MRRRVYLRPFRSDLEAKDHQSSAAESLYTGPQDNVLAERAPVGDPSAAELHQERTARGCSASFVDGDPGRLYRLYRRARDIVFAILALFLFLLILPMIALAIKLDSPGPVFYMQERVGLNRRRRSRGFSGDDQRKVLQPGRPFSIYKLRTMRTDAEASGPQWAARKDARITRVGQILRKSRLDEFPQFINVLRGEMTLIGPRPERLCFIRKLEKDVPHYRDRLLVLPGITGLAQVKNGYDDSAESVQRKVELDREYILGHSIWGDLKIILSTIKVLITGEGAY